MTNKCSSCGDDTPQLFIPVGKYKVVCTECYEEVAHGILPVLNKHRICKCRRAVPEYKGDELIDRCIDLMEKQYETASS